MNLKSLYRLFLICVLPALLCACNKNNNDVPDATPNPAHLAFVNVIPEAPAINLYFNGTRQTGNKVAYLESSGYISVASGLQNASFKDTTYAQLQLAPISLIPDSNYTMFVTGDYNTAAKVNTVSTILTSNNEFAVAGKPKLRFVNASPNSPALDVYLNNLLLSNKSYKSVSGYARADSGVVAVKVNISGTVNTVLNTTITLNAGSVYTLYAYGLVNQAGTKGFNVGLR